MKITDVKVWLVRGIKYNWTLLKIYTDEGYTGVGEATNWPGSPIVFEAAKHVGLARTEPACVRSAVSTWRCST